MFVVILTMGIKDFEFYFFPLEKLNVDPSSVTVNGFSAGASFAHQFQIAYSKDIAGVGMFATCKSNVK